MIDFEIYGKQHLYPENVEHDCQRDAYLKNKDG
jgi:very-short-patch-repair endonuclease